MIVSVKQSRGSLLEAQVLGNYSVLRDLKKEIIENWLPGLAEDDFYLEHNGKILSNGLSVEEEVRIYVVPRVKGGKGGFGSMLRAIGAQIEKTTNRDACRDLSGRRLRDINEEQRLKKWFARQKEREQERKDRKQMKLNRLRLVADGPPLPKIDDQEFLQQREDIVDAVFEAVDEAFKKGRKVVDTFGTDSDSSSSLEETSSQEEVKEAVVEERSKNEGAVTDSSHQGSSAQESSDRAIQANSSSSSKADQKSMKRTMFDEELDTDDSTDEDEDEEMPSPTKRNKIN